MKLNSQYQNEFHCSSSITLSDVMWVLLLNSLIFESPLTTCFGPASYIDEIITIFLILNSLWHISQFHQKQNKTKLLRNLLIITLLLIFIILGIAENNLFKIQTQAFPICIDIFTCIKFIIAILAGNIVFRDKNSNILRILLTEIKIFLLITIPFAALNQFINMGMRFDQRFGLYSFKFIFSHPAELAMVMATFSALLSIDYKKNLLWIILTWIYMILSLRTVAIAYVLISLFLLLTIRKNHQIKAGYIGIIILIALATGWNQFNLYYNNGTHARRILYTTAFSIAWEYFPLGPGFATFGSTITTNPSYYSPLYHSYGFDNIYGLTMSNSSFMSDTFWPIIIGQFGWTGLLIFVIILILTIRTCLMKSKKSFKLFLPVCMILIYLAISTVSSSAFFAPMAIFSAICLDLLSNLSKEFDGL